MAEQNSNLVEDFNTPKEWSNELNEVGNLDDYRFCNYKTLTFSNLVEDTTIRVAQDWRIGKGGLFWDCGYIMARILLDYLSKNP